MEGRRERRRAKRGGIGEEFRTDGAVVRWGQARPGICELWLVSAVAVTGDTRASSNKYIGIRDGA